LDRAVGRAYIRDIVPSREQRGQKQKQKEEKEKEKGVLKGGVLVLVPGARC
jgi:hypothetical protein